MTTDMEEAELDEVEQDACAQDEEARHYGSPHVGQTWSDVNTTMNGFGEVVLSCVNYSTVCFRDPKTKKTIPMHRKDFERWFSYVTSPFDPHRKDL